jgi:chemotaxis-related protein WspB
MPLFLQIRTGTQGYLLEARYITRVLPLMRIRSIPLAVEGVSGIINYQGSPVPVLDLCEILLQRPAVRHVSTRLILLSVVNFPVAERLRTHGVVALLAEGVSGVIRLAPGDFVASVGNGSGSCLGPVTNVGGCLLQKIELAALLSAEGISTLRIDSGNAA